jgi:hypothetical protein
MDMLFQIIGYGFIVVVLAVLFYVLGKILALGFNSMRNDDGND